jgi:hypothetical protein
MAFLLDVGLLSFMLMACDDAFLSVTGDKGPGKTKRSWSFSQPAFSMVKERRILDPCDLPELGGVGDSARDTSELLYTEGLFARNLCICAERLG